MTWSDARGFAAQFVPDDAARAAYPFEYEFTVTYRFEPLGLTCEYALANLGSTPLPWSAGHHFYFKLPWSETAAPMRSSTSAKRTSPWTLSRPTPSTRTGPPPSAPAARK